jgi:hypothetical protein
MQRLAVDPTTRHLMLRTFQGMLTVMRNSEGLAGIYCPGHWTKPDPARFGVSGSAHDFADIVALHNGIGVSSAVSTVRAVMLTTPVATSMTTGSTPSGTSTVAKVVSRTWLSR